MEEAEKKSAKKDSVAKETAAKDSATKEPRGKDSTSKAKDSVTKGKDTHAQESKGKETATRGRRSASKGKEAEAKEPVKKENGKPKEKATKKSKEKKEKVEKEPKKKDSEKKGKKAKAEEAEVVPAKDFKELFTRALAKGKSYTAAAEIFERDLKSLPKDGSFNSSASEFFRSLLEVIGESSDKLTKPKASQFQKMAMEAFAEFYTPKQEGPGLYKALFFPDKENEKVLVEWLNKAKRSLDVCVFTITNNQLANALYDAHDDGVKVRVISDDECMKMMGSDVQELCERGIKVTIDSDPHAHMHNKFVIIDGKYLINGSFNWTTQAVCKNNENVTITDNLGLIQQYQVYFDKLWDEFKGNKLKKTGNIGKRFAERGKAHRDPKKKVNEGKE